MTSTGGEDSAASVLLALHGDDSPSLPSIRSLMGGNAERANASPPSGAAGLGAPLGRASWSLASPSPPLSMPFTFDAHRALQSTCPSTASHPMVCLPAPSSSAQGHSASAPLALSPSPSSPCSCAQCPSPSSSGSSASMWASTSPTQTPSSSPSPLMAPLPPLSALHAQPLPSGQVHVHGHGHSHGHGHGAAPPSSSSSSSSSFSCTGCGRASCEPPAEQRTHFPGGIYGLPPSLSLASRLGDDSGAKTAAGATSSRRNLNNGPAKLPPCRLKNVGVHFPAYSRRQKRCKWCYCRRKKRRESSYSCSSCGIQLCIVPCFQEFHTVL